jgi:SAM-dependent methyltransferase
MAEHAGGSSSKANFDSVYDRADPRAYYRELRELDYEVPHHGQQVFRRVLDRLAIRDATVVDLCCSYGINAALLKHDLELSDLYERYCGEETSRLTRDELVAADRVFYAERRRSDSPAVIGIDVAARAVAYAVDVRLLDHGAAEDLERRDPSPELARAVADVDLITVTGGIGYITERTLERVIDRSDPSRPPWVAALCLRTISYAPIAAALARRGLVTEELEGRTFPQRRFADAAERDYALRSLEARGLDPQGKEGAGAYHAAVYLSRPAGDVSEQPIETVLADLT